MWDFNRMASRFAEPQAGRLLLRGIWGLEKEAQRIDSSGNLAMTPHPEAFGDKLHHSGITVDFAESQLELITPPQESIMDAYEALQALHDRVEAGIGEELLWPFSMPPRLPEEDRIPIAAFGGSEAGAEHEIYRNSLALRYGKKMQMISGLHYNYSFHPELLDALYLEFGQGRDRKEWDNGIYFAVARNALRYRWLLIYLYGASPSADPTYEPVICRELAVIEQCCPDCCCAIGEMEQYAVSLRVSRYGYSSALQRNYPLSFNSLAEYAAGYRTLLGTKSRLYEKLGTHRDGRQIQLNGNILQKESELYAPIRLKRTPLAGESQLDALEQRGVAYVELRILDINPFERAGLSVQQMRVLHLFMLFCLFEPSPPISKNEDKSLYENHHLVSLQGRKPGLTLRAPGGRMGLRQWGGAIMDKLAVLARLLDEAEAASSYSSALEAEARKLADPSLLPSAVMQEQMKANRETFLEFGLRWARSHKSSARGSVLTGGR